MSFACAEGEGGNKKILLRLFFNVDIVVDIIEYVDIVDIFDILQKGL